MCLFCLNLFNLSTEVKYIVENIKAMLEVPNMYIEENNLEDTLTYIYM